MNRSKKCALLTGAVAILVPLVAAQPAYAQDAAAAPETQPSASSSPASAPNAATATPLAATAPLSESDAGARAPATVPQGPMADIVVTAERRSSSLQKTPVAVTVLGGEALRESGRATLTQILEDVPGAVVNGAPTTNVATAGDSPATAISIRGVETNQSIPGNPAAGIPAVAYYVDGVINGIGGDYDLTNVQILRGPQGTLYGRSATSGAVIVTATDPDTRAVSGRADVEGGSRSFFHATGALNVPLSDTFAIRVSADHRDADGPFVSSDGKFRNNQARIKALFEPSTDLTISAGFAYQDLHSTNGGRVASVVRTSTAADNVVFDKVVPIGHLHSKTAQAWGQVDWNLGAVKLTYIPSYRDYKQDSLTFASSGLITSDQVHVGKDTFLTQELRLSGEPGQRLQWQAGVFYYDNDVRINSQAQFRPGGAPLPPGSPILNSAQPLNKNTKNVGLFAEGTYNLFEHTHITGGIRYDYTRVKANEFSCFGGPVELVACNKTIPATPPVYYFSSASTFKDVTYKARVTQDITSRNLLYASISTGVLPGDVAVTTGISSTTPVFAVPTDATYTAEKLTSYEIGTKNRFFNNVLQVNAAAFYYDFGAHQVAVQFATLPGGLQALRTYAIPATIKGAELEAILTPTKADRLGLNVSYTDATYHDKPAMLATNGYLQNHKIGGIVPWQVNPSYQHTFYLPRDRELTFGVRGLYRSGYLVNDVTRAVSINPGYAVVSNPGVWRLDLDAALKVSKNLSFSVYARNVTKNVYKTYVRIIGGGSLVGLSEPRTIGAVMLTKF